MFICCTASPTAARKGLPTQRSHITHIPYSEIFRHPTYTHTLILKTEAARCSETSENPLLRGANAPKMTITTHIVENTLLYLSSDGKTLAVQTSTATYSLDTAESLWTGKGGRAVRCPCTITEPGERTRGTTKTWRGGRANNEWQS
jgi:hypothetical protein